MIFSGMFLLETYFSKFFFCLRFFRGRKVYQELIDQKAYQYDAFVAYHSNDTEWVKDQLLAHLEHPEDEQDGGRHRSNFKLCCHERDFIPGTPIVENIVESINNSQKTILVVTNSFVESNWCDFELQMARMHSFEEGRDIIIVIMLEPVPAAKMSATLEAEIKKVTFIEWPEDVRDQAAFWKKLRTTLKRKDTRDPVCECGRTVYREERI